MRRDPPRRRAESGDAAYRLDRENVAVPDPTNPAVTTLVDAQRTKGVELGVSGTLWVSAGLHVLTVVCLAAVGVTLGRGPAYYAGTFLVGALLVVEHAMVRPSDLSKINKAFFDVNGVATDLGLMPKHGTVGEKALLLLRGFGLRA